MMANNLANMIDTSIHPLKNGNPPEWASGWGQDNYGVWVEFTLNDVTQRMRWIQPGEFIMGSDKDEPGHYEDEEPQHQVVLRKGFWLFDTPVTQALWQVVMGNNLSEFKSSDRPVENVNWNESKEFISKINRMISGLNLSLPSESQWEYACRAGTKTALYNGDIEIIGERNAPALDSIAWYGGNSGEEFELENGYDSSDWKEQQYPHKKSGSHPVAKKLPNQWGLYDMLGNVWEWTEDSWHDNYEGAPTNGAAWVDEDADVERVIRGGGWVGGAVYCRSACRGRNVPDGRDGVLGFRCARVQV